MRSAHLSPAPKSGRGGNALREEETKRRATSSLWSLVNITAFVPRSEEIERPHQKRDLLRETEMTRPDHHDPGVVSGTQGVRKRTTTAGLEGLASPKKPVQWFPCGSTHLGFHANLVLQ